MRQIVEYQAMTLILRSATWRVSKDGPWAEINGFWYEVLKAFATKRRDRRAALKFLKRTSKRNGRQRSIVTDRLGSYRSAMMPMGDAADQEYGRWLNNRAENSHQPLRRREGAMAKFRDV